MRVGPKSPCIESRHYFHHRLEKNTEYFLLVGIIIALFQALTQIQEMTLVFIPKIVAIFLTMLIALPFMGAALGGYMNRVAVHIVGG